jgi:hypothetical protein
VLVQHSSRRGHLIRPLDMAFSPAGMMMMRQAVVRMMSEQTEGRIPPALGTPKPLLPLVARVFLSVHDAW